MVVVGGSGGYPDEDHRERVRTLAAAALDSVDRAIKHPGLVEGTFDHARSLLSRLGEGDVGHAGSP